MHLKSGSLAHVLLDLLNESPDAGLTRNEVIHKLQRRGQLGHAVRDINRLDTTLSRVRTRQLVDYAGEVMTINETGRHLIAGVDEQLSRGESLTLALLLLDSRPTDLAVRARSLGIHHTRQFYQEHLGSLVAMDLITRQGSVNNAAYVTTRWGRETQQRIIRQFGWTTSGPPEGWVYRSNTAPERRDMRAAQSTPGVSSPQAAD